jgi:hypothetical protein
MSSISFFEEGKKEKTKQERNPAKFIFLKANQPNQLLSIYFEFLKSIKFNIIGSIFSKASKIRDENQ